MPVTPPAGQVQADKQRDGEAVPRPFSIQRRDLINYGHTGCYAAANDRKYNPHTTQCRDRLEKAMLDDETQSNRVKDARAREDAFLEQKIREADEASKSMQVEARRLDPIHEDRMSSSIPTPPTPVAEMQTNKHGTNGNVEDGQTTMAWDDMLNENKFHDVVNNDEEMYAAITDVMNDDNDMVDQIVWHSAESHLRSLVATSSDKIGRRPRHNFLNTNMNTHRQSS